MKIIKASSILLLMIGINAHADTLIKGKANHLYTLKITSTTGKQVPLSGSMMQWPQGAPVGFYDFGAAKMYTPYEGQLTASEIMLNVTSQPNNPIKVELIDNDNSKDVSLEASGNYLMLYSDGGNGSFIASR